MDLPQVVKNITLNAEKKCLPLNLYVLLICFILKFLDLQGLIRPERTKIINFN